jgi:phosphoglycolate phosphatase
MLNGIAAVAFDLDGTLVDSAPDIAHALNTALAEAGMPRFDLQRVRPWIGDGPDALIQRALAAHGQDAAPMALRTQLRAAFDMATLCAPLDHGGVFDGIAAMLERLAAAAMPLVVVTNKPTALARAVLAAARLLPHLSGVHGADAPAQRKPSPLLLQDAARRLNLRPLSLLMVGDGPADVSAARAAGCPAALVEWGYAPHAVEHDPRLWRVRTPEQLLRSLRCDAMDPRTARRPTCSSEAEQR